MSWTEYFLLAFASTVWPILIVVVIAALRTSRPEKLLLAFLAGGLLTTIGLGLVLVNVLDTTSVGTERESQAPASVSIAAGVLSLIAAAAVRRSRPKVRSGTKRSSFDADHYLSNLKLAFAAGVVLNILPGFFPFVAMVGIAKGHFSFAAEFVLVAFFYLIMFAFVEVPLVGYAVAPDRTQTLTNRFNAWLDRNGRRLATYALAAVGVYLIVRGILAL
jgi:Sap-like sulfolipid-1-addressing protein